MLLDAFGTLVHFADPAPALRDALHERLGVQVGIAEARAAMRAEVAFYRAHHDEAADSDGLRRLRLACGEVVRAALCLDAPVEPVAEALVDAIRFEPFPEVVEVLDALRAGGTRLAVVSNWDVSLHGVLARLGLGERVDAVLTSAEEGVGKPAPEIFERALARVGAYAHEALHVGDSLEHDVRGAEAAGIRAVLVARDGPRPEGVDSVASLAELL